MHNVLFYIYRAIGAQIEKTTNREACRDLSGRRLRDINEEKRYACLFFFFFTVLLFIKLFLLFFRLKDWVSKQADREKEREDRKQKKLDKLRQEYKHEFHDPEYFKARSEVTDKVHDALVQGEFHSFLNAIPSLVLTINCLYRNPSISLRRRPN